MTEPLTILYFAWLRETIGTQREELALPDGVATVGGLVQYLSQRSPAYAAAFSPTRKVRCEPGVRRSVDSDRARRRGRVLPAGDRGLGARRRVLASRIGRKSVTDEDRFPTGLRLQRRQVDHKMGAVRSGGSTPGCAARNRALRRSR
jgi:molybdopterin converting factor small subunit